MLTLADEAAPQLVSLEIFVVDVLHYQPGGRIRKKLGPTMGRTPSGMVIITLPVFAFSTERR